MGLLSKFFDRSDDNEAKRSIIEQVMKGKPLATITVSQAEELYDDLRRAIDEVRDHCIRL